MLNELDIPYRDRCKNRHKGRVMKGVLTTLCLNPFILAVVPEVIRWPRSVLVSLTWWGQLFCPVLVS